MGQPIEPSPEFQEHWASAPSHGSYFEEEAGTAPRSTWRRNLGWAGFALFLTLAGLLTAGYTLGLLDDWAEWRPSPRKIVTSPAGGGNTRGDRRGSFHRQQRASG